MHVLALDEFTERLRAEIAKLEQLPVSSFSSITAGRVSGMHLATSLLREYVQLVEED